MLKIRLSKKGIKKKPCYKIVVTDSRNPRDGRFIEKLGFFHPFNIHNKTKVNKKRMDYWISKGAILSKRIYSLLK
ncbi:30S ribosomal protein S16 [Enterobacteriaceae endosymbiont of Neohaemonia nigricornis]|uniref:30S ribosomal protein S16 n=1 Tax=Enterobacteriaceae endosymbiont of Neohaemonia nigricornis TaxID=2675792 RepID=UPI0014498D4E|nr:30S ribosomal protein S16 [Enterobacteriaceae endosymbiont of Neohaemonia nigricornis]QJC30577.1 30S ribosomal protein S16 [Enterobacteriaceae endosymbiont of Neohaemonia nigricornis]